MFPQTRSARYDGKTRTVLIQKDVIKGNIANCYYLITCVPVMRKILTAMVAEKAFTSPEDGESQEKNPAKRSHADVV